MPDLKISQLTAGSLAQAGDEIPIARSGANYKITGADIAAAATSVGTLSSLTVSGDLTVDTSTLKVDSANNRVGIGTVSPAATLHVSTAGTSLAQLTGAEYSQIRHSDGTRVLYTQVYNNVGVIGTESNTPLAFNTNNTEKMRLDASGNLGIGVTSPAYPLHVERSSYGMTGYFFANDGTRNPRLAIYGNSSGTTIQHTFSTSADALMFAVGGAIGSGTERMRLDANGNLGIGTTSPVTALTLGSGTTGMTFRSASDALNSGKIGVINAVEIGSGNGSLIFETYAGGAGGGERMRLDASGNLGIGVTPSAWWSTARVMQVGNGGYVQGRSNAVNTVEIGANQFINASVQRTYIGNGEASYYEQAGGAHQFYTAASGTAGNAITFTQAMTLDASGRLLVGTTTAAGKVSVGGSGANRISFEGPTGALYVGYDGSTDALQVASNSAIIFQSGSSYTERARITSGGSMVVGTAAIATTATDGFLYVPTCAGTPTGTPTTQTGTAPIVVDTTNNKLYFYSGGSWRDAGP